MKGRWVAGVLSVLAMGDLRAAPPSGCDQPGYVVFDDAFADNRHGWIEEEGKAAVKPPAFVFTLKTRGLYQSFPDNAVEAADYCATFILPKFIEGRTDVAVGLQFWAASVSDKHIALAYSNGTVVLARLTPEKTWTLLAESAQARSVRPGEINTLRVAAAPGKVDIYVNGQLALTAASQKPGGPLWFGLSAQANGGDLPQPVEIRLSRFTATTGE